MEFLNAMDRVARHHKAMIHHTRRTHLSAIAAGKADRRNFHLFRLGKGSKQI
jgi:hypothetical protein